MVELRAFELEVFAGAGDVGVVEVGAVEIVDLGRTMLVGYIRDGVSEIAGYSPST